MDIRILVRSYEASKNQKLQIRKFSRQFPPAPINHVKIFKGWSLLDAPSKMVQLWYKTFPSDQRGQLEMKNQLY